MALNLSQDDDGKHQGHRRQNNHGKVKKGARVSDQRRAPALRFEAPILQCRKRYDDKEKGQWSVNDILNIGYPIK